MRTFLLALVLVFGCTGGKPGGLDAGVALSTPDLATPDLGPSPPDLATPDLAPGFMAVPGTCTESGWCWENPLPQGNQLRGLWSFASNDVWAVGNAGTILHFDGTAWSGVPSGTDQDLQALWASGPGDLWTVGYRGVIRHYDGQRWQTVASGTTASLNAVFGLGTSDVWVGGDAGLLLHWQGGAFVPVASGTLADVRGLWGSAANDLWALIKQSGRPLLHWDGQKWASNNGVGFGGAIFGTSATDAWVTGDSPLQWTGTLWGSYKDLRVRPGYALWASGSKDYWAIGGPSIDRWNGNLWQPQRTPLLDLGNFESLQAGRGLGPNDMWVASYRPHHWDGAVWTSWGGGAQPLLLNGWALNSFEAWVVGKKTILRRLNSGIWLPVEFPAGNHPSGNQPRGIWGSGANDIWVAGSTGSNMETGFIVHWDGAKWTAFEDGSFTSISGIFGSSPTLIYAIGPNGLIIKWDGMRWKKIQSGTTTWLNSIWSDSLGTFWIGGDDGIVLRIENGNLSKENLPEQLDVHQIAGDESSNIWVAAGNAIYHRGGVSWSKSYQRAGGYINAIGVRDKTEVWASDSPTSLLQWDGNSWNSRLLPTRFPIYSLFGDSQKKLWIIGSDGAILSRK